MSLSVVDQMNEDVAGIFLDLLRTFKLSLKKMVFAKNFATNTFISEEQATYSEIIYGDGELSQKYKFKIRSVLEISSLRIYCGTIPVICYVNHFRSNLPTIIL